MGQEELTGRVIKLMPYGVFVKLDEGKVGLIHISQLNNHGEDGEGLLKEGDRVVVNIIGKGKTKDKLNFSFVKKLDPAPATKRSESSKESFDKMMRKFLKDSQENQTVQKKRMKRHRGMAA